ncbi:MAG: hypothetical protein A3H42_05390 [Deltaproteobacteria bacterium RIFCSPLOWO2_02_FULL_46_8]|nr:MAG: hypothetical protein A3H42_05390 [Deltaproteobacteria bacterium RIFCSPLOWO2_02_FULL_46_8]
MNNTTIAAYYEVDHNRLDELFEAFHLWKRKDFPKAKEFFREFKFGLQRHIVWEEEILFPLFEEKTGMRDCGPTAVMRMEHRQIKAALEAIHEKVKAKNPDSDTDEEQLISILSQHNQKEENILYPGIDHALQNDERKQVFQKMKEIPEERFQHCCGG